MADRAMERYASGDDASFAELYDALCPRLLAFVRRQARDDSLAEDLVQQTFLHMHRARGQFIRGAEVVPWAFAIARHLITDSMRRQRVESRLSDDVDAGDAGERPSRTPGADEELQAREVAVRLDRAMARLPGSQRMAFELLKLDGLSLSQAAAVLGISVTAVKLRAHRAYVALRSVLGEIEHETDGDGASAADHEGEDTDDDDKDQDEARDEGRDEGKDDDEDEHAGALVAGRR